MAVRVRLDRLKSIKVRAPRVKDIPVVERILTILHWVLNRLFIFLGIAGLLLAASELFVYMMDAGSGIDNYVDWWMALIVPIMLSGLCWTILLVMNFDEIKNKLFPSRNTKKNARQMEPIELD